MIMYLIARSFFKKKKFIASELVKKLLRLRNKNVYKGRHWTLQGHSSSVHTLDPYFS
jgi:hypothetical protein